MNAAPPSDAFVGRAAELEALAAAVDGGASIVTLWGPPGIGKTRLALELVRRGALRGGRPVRAAFCDLVDVADCAQAEERVAAAARALLGGAGDASVGELGAVLAALGPAVLVLDAFEPLAPSAAETLGAWAAAAPDACFVVTTRERLRLAGEVTLEIGPLGPEAAALFRARAGAVPGEGDPAVDEALTEVLALLENNPLAIELAASRVDVLGVAGLRARLASPLEVLARVGREAGTRHASLREAIDASLRLLAPVERSALAQCTVFEGRFTLEAAEAVISLDAGSAVLDVLQGLRDRSLLRRPADGGVVRFALSAWIRARAGDAPADAAAVEAARARHGSHFLATTPTPAEHADVAAAATRVLDAGADRDGLAALLARLDEVEPTSASDALVEVHGRALAEAERAGVAAPVRARAHRARGKALQQRRRHTDARAELERALALAAGDEALAGDLWADLGVLAHETRDLDEARRCYERALALQERHGRGAALGRTLGNLGAVHHDVRRYAEAMAHYELALAALRDVGEHRLEGIILANVAVLWQERGAAARARATYETALERLARAEDVRLEAITRTNLGLLWHEIGELAAARASHERALTALAAVVDPRSRALCLGRLAMALAASGEHAEAVRCCERAEAVLAPSDDRIGTAVLRVYRTFVDVAAGNPARAAERLAEARAPGFAGGASLVDVSDDARAAVRLVEAALAADGAPRSVLLVGREARWFVPPGAAAAEDLAGRRVLRRLLHCLVEHHLDAPGEGLTLDALREAGWPGERATAASAVNRVHVALAELRRRGLRTWLVRREARYLIDPALRVDLSDG